MEIKELVAKLKEVKDNYSELTNNEILSLMTLLTLININNSIRNKK